ncbi:hypothetical protein AALO_G00149960 [Alosa alosa]|uniref:Uncharacterized protein n=1 Tax=Alosa alosa TaxID=278164 RepID=A0AAV6GEQ9_9TELE|nr:hypothetical protein AALO_G00149960 [Alosa alosa]
MEYEPLSKEQVPMQVMTHVVPIRDVHVDMPRDHIIWSVFNLIFCCNPCCLALMAFFYSIKSRDRKIVGDLEGARSLGSTAYWLNVLALSIIVAFVIIMIIICCMLF